MSTVGLGRLARDIARIEGVTERLRADPHSVLAQYPLTGPERDAVLRLDAAALVGLGLNPLVMRNLLFLLGVPNADLYTHRLSLGAVSREDADG
ncbi:hypothetical protein AB0L71_08115 [Streptomyces sp. NPDC052052]|uniref:hypothetical protein n=1 Tax=Streptomyces sp. NPDC052052 TaxID=3154756 RepID=UPI0034168343